VYTDKIHKVWAHFVMTKMSHKLVTPEISTEPEDADRQVGEQKADL
jgi:hypothetical protein